MKWVPCQAYLLKQKNNLRNNFKQLKKYLIRDLDIINLKIKKEQFVYLEKHAQNCNKTDTWSTLKKLNNPRSSRAALEIVRADKSISRDIQEILERWHADISKLLSGIKDHTEMVFDDQFYEEILRKKSEFENLSFEEQYTEMKCLTQIYPIMKIQMQLIANRKIKLI